MMHPFFTLVPLFALVSASVLKHEQKVWQPLVGASWQIVLKNSLSVASLENMTAPAPEVLDVDLFDTSTDVIKLLHARGKKVICYFSAGTAEDWRLDYASFLSTDLGNKLEDWPREKYVNIRSSNVIKIMIARIGMAKDKDCDGVDPDNTDVFSNPSGFDISQEDATKFFKNLAAEAHSLGMSIGLKNSLEILWSVMDDIQFAVNEECQANDECENYGNLIQAGKPVFNIEYVTRSLVAGKQVLKSDSNRLENVKSVLCSERNLDSSVASGETLAAHQLSTVIKESDLSDWAYQCDGSSTKTP